MDKIKDIDYRAYLRSPEWQAKREVRLRVDDYRCARCGQTELLEVHHLTYVRLWQERTDDLLTLCGDCHDEEHGIEALDSFAEIRRRQKFYRKVYVEHYGSFPHPCYFCDSPVDGHTRPLNSTAAVVHHLDENRKNNDYLNLAPAHHGCHVSFHHRGKSKVAWNKGMKYSPEMCINMRAGNKGLAHTLEARAKMSAAGRGRSKSPKARANMSKAQKGHPGWFKGKKHSPETLEKMRAAHAGHKRQTPKVRAKISASKTGQAITRVCCISCHREIAISWIARHRCA